MDSMDYEGIGALVLFLVIMAVAGCYGAIVSINEFVSVLRDSAKRSMMVYLHLLVLAIGAVVALGVAAISILQFFQFFFFW